MGREYLADTNAVIDFCNGKLPEKGKRLLLSASPQISVITQIELFATKNISTSEFDLLRKFVALSRVHSLTENLVELVIQIRQDYRLKIPDAIIAATALQQQLPLISRNESDFARIPEMQFINPHLL